MVTCDLNKIISFRASMEQAPKVRIKFIETSVSDIDLSPNAVECMALDIVLSVHCPIAYKHSFLGLEFSSGRSNKSGLFIRASYTMRRKFSIRQGWLVKPDDLFIAARTSISLLQQIVNVFYQDDSGSPVIPSYSEHNFADQANKAYKNYEYLESIKRRRSKTPGSD